MQAIVCDRYGPPEDLELKEIPVPKPNGSEVLVRVRASAINDYDWSIVRGRPYLYRLIFGFRRPRKPIPGMELSGVIEALGPDAKAFSVGDPVFGDTSDHNFGTFAEFVCINEKALLRKPDPISYAEAAAVPHALCLANQGLELGGLRDGMSILINGAGGGVGTFALQLAKQRGARVVGVDTGDKLAAMRSMGFDDVLDYRTQDFADLGERYDLVLDAKSTRSPRSVRRALMKGGVYVTVGGTIPRLLQFLVSGWTDKNMRILGLRANAGLVELAPMLGRQLRPVVDGPYPLREAPQRIRYFGEGEHFGKVVLEP